MLSLYTELRLGRVMQDYRIGLSLCLYYTIGVRLMVSKVRSISSNFYKKSKSYCEIYCVYSLLVPGARNREGIVWGGWHRFSLFS